MLLRFLAVSRDQDLSKEDLDVIRFIQEWAKGGEPEGAARPMRWGFEKPQGGLVINARVETIGERPMFRALAQKQRCAMPASGYYEWRRSDRQKYTVALASAGRFYLAGLWRVGVEGPEFVVLTQPPVEAIVPVHNRMRAGETPLYADSAALRVAAAGPEQLSMLF